MTRPGVCALGAVLVGWVSDEADHLVGYVPDKVVNLVGRKPRFVAE